MAQSRSRQFVLDGVRVPRGQMRDIRLQVSQRYTGDPVTLPVRVIRGQKPGPALFVSAAIHGHELNGVGIIHELMFYQPPEIRAGTLVLMPVVNIFGFETQSRYMPDRRDLNRSFPGRANGSLAARLAHQFFESIVRKCDYGIDLHTAPAMRTNFPNVRADLRDKRVRELAEAFGCELLVQSRGPEGSMRREAVSSGCAVITVEAGEPLKIEPTVLEVGVRGVNSCLAALGLTKGEVYRPPAQVRISRSTWVRAELGGILRFHVSPGEVVDEGQAIATNISVYGEAQNVLRSPAVGVVLGMTTLPTVKPGEPVCHLALPRGKAARLQKAFSSRRHLTYQQLRDDLATNIAVTEQEADLPATEIDDEPAAG
jgi:hypothetical protein